MPTFLRHPLTHILLLGAILAVAILAIQGPPTGDTTRRVVISAGDLLQLQAGFKRTWQRDPTPTELRGELERHIRQEILYREALARGYDRDDVVVRRAMEQKMDLLATSQATAESPAEQEIEAFFTLRQERYRTPAVLSFAHVYVAPDAHAESPEEVAAAILARLLRDDPDPRGLAAYGDPIMLEPYYAGRTDRDVRSAFGEEFTEAVLALEPGSWHGPVPSGYGLHLVKVTHREDSRIPEWTDVAAQVVRDMEYEARGAAREQLFQEIAQNYQVVLDSQVRALLEPTSE